MNKNYKNNKGITLIALVVTIIVLLILAGVTINLTLGEGGIFKTAEQAVKNYTDAQDRELAELGDFTNLLNNTITGINSKEEEEQEKEFNTTKGVNKPKIEGTGLVPVTINANGSLTEVSSTDNSWYDYVDTSVSGKTSTSKWANAKTQDGSMWVWIPRFAYKITYKDASDKSAGGTIDVVFLQETGKLDKNGNDVTSTSYVNEKGVTGAYIVHPAFQDGRSNNYANGEWDEEITGFWMAKFEAGYEDASAAKNSTVVHSVIYGYNATEETNVTENYYGTRQVGTAIKYPVFKASRPSMNYLGISDAYNLSKSLTASGNPYGISNVDSHLMKNSEWGAVAYLTDSKYGRNGAEVTINNVSVNGESTVYAVTGYGASDISGKEDTTRELATLTTEGQTGSWITKQGQTASSTGNVYGIYDLSGGTWEWTAGYIETEGNYETYGGSLKGESNKYKSKYAGTSDTDTTRKGEAIWETSDLKTDTNSWYSECSLFWNSTKPFSVRGGDWYNTNYAGVFAFFRSIGYSECHVGFRPVLVPSVAI